MKEKKTKIFKTHINVFFYKLRKGIRKIVTIDMTFLKD